MINMSLFSAVGPKTKFALCWSTDAQSSHFAVNGRTPNAKLFRRFSRWHPFASSFIAASALFYIERLAARLFTFCPSGSDTVFRSL
ncbi:hypothetical protein [Rhizobium ruizarguesonis]|uniref:hypothetical protein n=2 Tax=Rhizobium TaxID=379 RepID=UPI001954ED70|nr:hypothetical protein [Rhizobium ruizarguesonis]